MTGKLEGDVVVVALAPGREAEIVRGLTRAGATVVIVCDPADDGAGAASAGRLVGEAESEGRRVAAVLCGEDGEVDVDALAELVAELRPAAGTVR